MCYDISFSTNIETIQDDFPDLLMGPEQLALDALFSDHAQANYIRPEWPIIYRDQQTQELRIRAMEWGVIRFFARKDLDKRLEDDPDPAHRKTIFDNYFRELNESREKMFNAQSENFFKTNFYWNKIRNRRCLIPVTGIFEHRKIVKWTKMVPYHIRPMPHSPNPYPPFYLPGLYSVAEFPDLEHPEVINRRWTFTIATRTANDTVLKIHNHGDRKGRMVLFLNQERATRWLLHDLPEPEYRSLLDYQIPSEELDYYTTFTLRSPKLRPDGLRKHEPFAWSPTPPPLGEGDPPDPKGVTNEAA